MENHPPSFDVCIVCALPEEVRAFLEVVRQHCNVDFEELIDPQYKYDYRLTTIKNDRGEPLNLHISWLSRYGPQEMTLHLSHVLEECQPRIAIMTGICAGDARRFAVGVVDHRRHVPKAISDRERVAMRIQRIRRGMPQLVGHREGLVERCVIRPGGVRAVGES